MTGYQNAVATYLASCTPDCSAACPALGVPGSWSCLENGSSRRQCTPDASFCYTVSMKPKKSRRAGATETFSVSVDPETKKALRALADEDFDGNLSALVTDFAEEARRRLAAGAYLRMHGIPKLTAKEADELQAELDREVASARKRRKRRSAA